MLVIAPDLAEERSAPVYDWLVVGRECAGVDEQHRLLIDDPAALEDRRRNLCGECFAAAKRVHCRDLALFGRDRP